MERFYYVELCKKYKNFEPKTTCDTELLAWGLDEFGIDFIDQIDYNMLSHYGLKIKNNFI